MWSAQLVVWRRGSGFVVAPSADGVSERMATAARFGDFALLDDFGPSDVADRFRALHDVQGGPFFVKVYARLPTPFVLDLQTRAERLIAVRDPRLAVHLGHGLVDGTPFVVSPFVEGFDLEELGRSLRERRVTLPIEALLLIVREVALAVDALHAQSRARSDVALAHGEVTPRHVRITAQGQVLLTGLQTPRGPQPGVAVDVGLDAAGIGATVYDLMAMTRPGGVRLALPLPLEHLVRRALGIGPQAVRLAPREIAEAVVDVADAMRVELSTSLLPELAARTMKALGKRGKPLTRTGAADSLPVLEPIATSDEQPAPSLPRTRGAPEAVSLEAAPVEPHRVPAAPLTQTPPREAPRELSGKLPPAAAARPAGDPLKAPPRTPPPPEPIAQPPRTPPPVPRVTAPETSTPAAAPPPRPAVPPVPSPAAAVPSTAPPRAMPTSARVTASSPATPPLPAKASAPAPITALTEAPPDLGALRLASSDEDPWAPAEPAYLAADAPSALQEPTVEGPFELFSSGDRTTPEVASLPGHGDERAGLRDLRDTTRPERLPPDEPPATPTPVHGISALDFRDPTNASRTPRLADLPGDDKTRDGPPLASVTASELSVEPLSDNELLPTEPAVRALESRGAVTAAATRRAVDEQRRRGGRLLDILIADGAISDSDAADILADEAVKPRVSDDSLQRRLPPPELTQRLPQSFATEHRVLPLRLDSGVAVLAVADPFDDVAAAEVARILGAKSVHVHVATRAALTRAIAVAYRRGADASLETPLVLLCADDDDLAGRVGARLVTEGLRVEIAASLALARRVFASHALDACLVKSTLHDGAGTDLVIEVRGSPSSQDLPVFLFGPDDPGIEARALDLGADDYFGVPLAMDVVVRKLRRALAKRPPKPKAAPPPLVDAASTALPPLDQGFDPFAPPMTGDFGSVLEEAPAEPTGVMGTLKQMSVAEIVQSLELGRKTARVELVPNDGPKGTFAFDTGQIVFATRDDGLEGERAFYALAKHQEGFFRIHYGDQGPRRNIDKPTTFLLLEAMRLMDEDGRPEGAA